MKKIIMVLALASSACMQARYHMVSSQKEFERLLDRYEYAVVCFAPDRVSSDEQDKEVVNKSERNNIKQEFRSLKNSVEKASESKDFDTYLKQDVGFLVVNVANKKAQEVDKQYALTEFPVCMIFKNGQASSMTKMLRPKSRYDILSFVDKKVGAELDKIVKDRKEDDRRAQQDWIDSQYRSVLKYYPYGSWPAYTWSGPYWGGPYSGGATWSSGFPGAAWFVGF